MNQYATTLPAWRDRTRTATGKKYDICPACGEPSFITLIDTSTGQKLEGYGRCERRTNCGFDQRPGRDATKAEPPPPAPDRIQSHVLDILAARLPQAQALFRYLEKTLPRKAAERLESVWREYRVGSLKNGASAFLLHDMCGICRSGKIIAYNEATGHRAQGMTWVHTEIGIERFETTPTLFGEHLLPYRPLAPVRLVEGEKTALICAAVWPDFIWLAVGSMNWFTPQRLWALYDREVEVLPDANAFELWGEAAETIGKTVRAAGFELYDWRDDYDKDVWARIANPEKADVADLLIEYIKMKRGL